MKFELSLDDVSFICDALRLQMSETRKVMERMMTLYPRMSTDNLNDKILDAYDIIADLTNQLSRLTDTVASDD